MTTIQQNPFAELLENTMQSFLKEKIETLLKEEIKNYLQVEQADESNSRNGYYARSWETRHGMIPDLQVPRDGKVSFKRNCSRRISDGKPGWKTPSSTCTRVA